MDLGEFAHGPVTAELESGILRILLNRPEKRNAVNSEMFDALARLLAWSNGDPTVRAVLIAGSGTDFCAGIDAVELADRGAGTPVVAFEDRPVGRFVQELLRFEKTLIAAVKGRAIGFGLTLLFHCDLVYVADDAVLRAPFALLGLCPEAGSSLLAPMRVGHVRCFELFCLGRTLSGREAALWGLANEAVAESELEQKAFSAARQLADQSLRSVVACKRLMRRNLPLAEVVSRELAELAELRCDPQAS